MRTPVSILPSQEDPHYDSLCIAAVKGKKELYPPLCGPVLSLGYRSGVATIFLGREMELWPTFPDSAKIEWMRSYKEPHRLSTRRFILVV